MMKTTKTGQEALEIYLHMGLGPRCWLRAYRDRVNSCANPRWKCWEAFGGTCPPWGVRSVLVRYAGPIYCRLATRL